MKDLTESVEEEPGAFTPRHLNRDQLQALFAQDLQQAEAAVRAAWMALLLAQRNYRDTCAQLDAIEAELARLQEV